MLCQASLSSHSCFSAPLWSGALNPPAPGRAHPDPGGSLATPTDSASPESPGTKAGWMFGCWTLPPRCAPALRENVSAAASCERSALVARTPCTHLCAPQGWEQIDFPGASGPGTGFVFADTGCQKHTINVEMPTNRAGHQVAATSTAAIVCGGFVSKNEVRMSVVRAHAHTTAQVGTRSRTLVGLISLSWLW